MASLPKAGQRHKATMATDRWYDPGPVGKSPVVSFSYDTGGEGVCAGCPGYHTAHSPG